VANPYAVADGLSGAVVDAHDGGRVEKMARCSCL